MSCQLRHRLFAVWVLLSGLCLVAFYSTRSSTGARLLAWTRQGTLVEELKPNAAIVMLVAPSRIPRMLYQMDSRTLFPNTPPSFPGGQRP